MLRSKKGTRKDSCQKEFFLFDFFSWGGKEENVVGGREVGGDIELVGEE